MFRTVFALLITVAVTVAPVGHALAAAQIMDNATVSMPAMDMAGMTDCHRKMAAGHSDETSRSGQDHSCCGDAKAKCADICGITCCKLMGMAAELPEIGPLAFALPERVDPQEPPEWRLRPIPPPPRS